MGRVYSGRPRAPVALPEVQPGVGAALRGRAVLLRALWQAEQVLLVHLLQ